MDFVGIAGLLGSILGFATALWQLARTRRSAAGAPRVNLSARIVAVGTLPLVSRNALAFRMLFPLVVRQSILDRYDRRTCSRGRPKSDSASVSAELDGVRHENRNQGRATSMPAGEEIAATISSAVTITLA